MKEAFIPLSILLLSAAINVGSKRISLTIICKLVLINLIMVQILKKQFVPTSMT